MWYIFFCRRTANIRISGPIWLCPARPCSQPDQVTPCIKQRRLAQIYTNFVTLEIQNSKFHGANHDTGQGTGFFSVFVNRDGARISAITFQTIPLYCYLFKSAEPLPFNDSTPASVAIHSSPLSTWLGQGLLFNLFPTIKSWNPSDLPKLTGEYPHSGSARPLGRPVHER